MMIVSAFTALLPILFVMGLGYAAGRAKKFSQEQVMGLNELVLVYALPALMFVGTATTTRSRLLAEATYLLGVFIAMIGLFAVVLLFGLFVLRHSLGEAALQANLVTYPSVAFLGVPIFTGLFGSMSIVAVATATVISCGLLVPLTVVLLEIYRQRSVGGQEHSTGNALTTSLLNSAKEPMVWAPLLGVVLVLLDVAVPQEIDDMLKLLGSATSGTSLFLAGLIIASYRIQINLEILGDVLVKMIGQPALMVLLVAVLGIGNPLGREAIVLCAIPASVVAPLLGSRYQVYEIEAASTLVLTTLAMIITLPLIIVLIGA
ncbi:MAG TPA: AEC family transporter [Anaerolineae bacterium]|nr:AEC family transporter [Anaerolineae bacterium]